MFEEITKIVIYLVGIYAFIHILLFITKFFKELFEESWQILIGIAVFGIVTLVLQQLYVFDILLGLSTFVLFLITLLYFLHKKIGIIKFLKIFTGIDEYNKDETFWKKFFKILKISFTTIIFLLIALGIFASLIEMIFLTGS